ncbi:MAG TPA: fatty acid desaturase [Solirubrobacterales bacterium]
MATAPAPTKPRPVAERVPGKPNGRPKPPPAPDRPAMTRVERGLNVGAVVLPFAAFAAAIAFLPSTLLSSLDLVLLGVGYLVGGLGITIGFHRLLTHNAFATHRRLRYALAIAGSTAVEGPVISWVSDHRKHHAHADDDGDPHSPHVDHGTGLRGAVRGLYHAHMGWLWETQGRADYRRYAPDLLEDPGMRRINAAFPVIVAASLALPALVGGLATGSLGGAATGLLWGGFVRVFLLHHVTWSINSICHFFGRRRFDTDDRSTNVFWLAPFSFGESWHHNHHAFPRSATHGLRWYELDPAGWAIGGLERLGLAWNVVRIAPERQAQREQAPAPR